MAQTNIKTFLRWLDKSVDLIVVFFLLIFMIYGGYSMWDTATMQARASSTAYSIYRPAVDDTLGFEELQATNSNVFGWIEIFGTNINYPLVQGDDNERYVHTNARGIPAMSGAIFLDFRNNRNLTDFNNIIYGHDMVRGAMFGDIAYFEEDHFFESRRYGVVFNGEREYGIEILAFLLVDANDYEIYNPWLSYPALKELFLQRLFDEAIQYRDLNVTIDDRLVMLSTCTERITNGRHILIGRLMDEIPEDEFGNIVRRGSGVDTLLLGMSELGLVTGLLFLIIVAAGVTLFIVKQKRRSNNSDLNSLTIKEDVMFLLGKVVVVVMMTAFLFTFVFGFIQVDDASMAPSMQEGDIVFFQRMRGADLVATDTVVISHEGERQVRRVVAVAGDVVDITANGILINGLFQQEHYIFEATTQFVEGITFPLVVPEGAVFLLGDSRGRAYDSRVYGPVEIRNILGSVVTIIRSRDF